MPARHSTHPLPFAKPLMPKLSDLQASLLLQEIACAMRIGAPLNQALRRLESRRLGAVGSSAGAIADSMEKGLTLSESLRQLDPGGMAVAAAEACEQSGDPGLLDQFAFQLKRRAFVRSESRLAWFYPWVLLLVAYVVGVLVMAPLVRRYSDEGFRWPNWVVAVAEWVGVYGWVPPTIGILLFAAMSFWLWRRRTHSRPMRLSLFCAALADQISHDRPEQDAITLAADFSGDPSLKSIRQPTLLSPGVVGVVDHQGDWRRIVEQGDKLSMLAALRYRALLFEQSARRREYLWMRFMPRLAMVLVGAGLVLSYVWWVIAPVYREVATW